MRPCKNNKVNRRPVNFFIIFSLRSEEDKRLKPKKEKGALASMFSLDVI